MNWRLSPSEIRYMSGASGFDLLIVDDDPDFRETMVRRFRRRGINVGEAASGEEALQLAERRQFDVAVFDMVMPDMSGLELLEKFKAQHAECEVLLLTGQGSIETAVQAMKLGACEYLTKPFPLGDLEVLLDRAYDRRVLAKENRQLKSLLRQRTPPNRMCIHSESKERNCWRSPWHVI